MNGNVEFTENAPLVDGDVVTGAVTKVNPQSVFQSPSGKAVGLLFDRTPYQFSRQYQKTTIFVRALNSYGDQNSVGNQRALIFQGDIEGAVDEGNKIQAVVKERGGRLYVRQLTNLTTCSRVTATTQIGGGVAAVLAVLAVLAPLLLLVLLVTAVCNSMLGDMLAAVVGAVLMGLVSLLSPVLVALSPVLIVCAGIYILVKSMVR